jgi:hypothetical protein
MYVRRGRKGARSPSVISLSSLTHPCPRNEVPQRGTCEAMGFPHPPQALTVDDDFRYVESLENRLEKMEKLLQKVGPLQILCVIVAHSNPGLP